MIKMNFMMNYVLMGQVSGLQAHVRMEVQQGLGLLEIREGFVSTTKGFGIYAENGVLVIVALYCFVNGAFCLTSIFFTTIFVKGSYLLIEFAPIFCSFCYPTLLNGLFFFPLVLFLGEEYKYQVSNFLSISTFQIFIIYSYELITFFVLIYEKNIHQDFMSLMVDIFLIEQTFRLINFQAFKIHDSSFHSAIHQWWVNETLFDSFS